MLTPLASMPKALLRLAVLAALDASDAAGLMSLRVRLIWQCSGSGMIVNLSLEVGSASEMRQRHWPRLSSSGSELASEVELRHAHVVLLLLVVLVEP